MVPNINIAVSFNGDEVGTLINVTPSTTGHYYFASFPFTPLGTAGELLFTVATVGDSTALFDDVTVTSTSAVPEPTTYLADLSALGMLGLLGWRKRK